MPSILIIVALFAVLWFVMIRPQRAKAQEQQRMLSAVAVGDEILTVGGIYGIVQELETEEDGGDLIVEIAEGIHVRVARRALATVVKPDEDDDEDDDEDAELDDADVVDGEAEVIDDVELPVGAEAERVDGEQESLDPSAAEEAAPPSRS